MDGGGTVTIDVGTHDPACEAEEVSLDDGRRMLDAAARRYLNMSAEDFIAAWDEGRFTDPDSLRVQQVAALLPFGR